MPHIPKDRRRAINGFIAEVPQTSGELNYMLTECVIHYVIAHELSYATINDVQGALRGASAEFERVIVGPYEQSKCEENGNVYQVLLPLLPDA